MSSFQKIELLPEKKLWQILFGKKSFQLNPSSLYLLHTLREPAQIALFTGLNLAQSQKLAAILEIGGRIFRPTTSTTSTLHSPGTVYQYLKDLAHLEKEAIRALYLNDQLQILRDEIVALGSVNSASTKLKELIRPGILVNASMFIIAHNHPSGDSSPSEEDIELTHRIISIAKLFDLSLQDHLIITTNGYFSFRQKHPQFFS